MSDGPTPDTLPPTPLDYQQPRQNVPSPPSSLAPWAFIGGLLLGVCGVTCAGANWYLSLYGVNPGPKTVQAKPPIVFAALTLAALAGLGIIVRARLTRPSRPARFFFMGLLAGLGLTALLEGACFLRP